MIGRLKSDQPCCSLFLFPLLPTLDLLQITHLSFFFFSPPFTFWGGPPPATFPLLFHFSVILKRVGPLTNRIECSPFPFFFFVVWKEREEDDYKAVPTFFFPFSPLKCLCFFPLIPGSCAKRDLGRCFPLSSVCPMLVFFFSF